MLNIKRIFTPILMGLLITLIFVGQAAAQEPESSWSNNGYNNGFDTNGFDTNDDYNNDCDNNDWNNDWNNNGLDINGFDTNDSKSKKRNIKKIYNRTYNNNYYNSECDKDPRDDYKQDCLVKFGILNVLCEGKGNIGNIKF